MFKHMVLFSLLVCLLVGITGGHTLRQRPSGTKLSMSSSVDGATRHMLRPRPSGTKVSMSTSVDGATIDGTTESSRFYTWRQSNWIVHYETKGPLDVRKPILLLLPGFGVGTFYYQSQLEELSKDYRVFAMDLLGQGKSWPEGKVSQEQQLCFSTDLWVEQVVEFIDNILGGEQVHVFGNSLGGYLATHAAARRPELFKSVILANAAPFWAFAPARSSNSSSDGGFFGLWDGTLPAPEPIFNFGSAYFDLIRSRPSVLTMLKGVYHNEAAFDEKLVQDIIASASHPNGYEAFTSILFSPKTERSFDESLRRLRGIPTLLLYGKNDPWVVPYWGQRAYKALTEDSEDGAEPMAHYLEIRNCGHSPNHEAPLAVNSVLGAWIECLSSLPSSPRGPVANQVMEKRLAEVCEVPYEERSGSVTKVDAMDGRPTTLTERLLSFFDDVRLSS
jgi:pimeloyl-ACP methyl ester carboxylesterase